MKTNDIAVPVPGYLERVYFGRLRDAALDALGEKLERRTLQPEDVRRRTLAEAPRIYLPMLAILRTLEPLAMDLWRRKVAAWLPGESAVEKSTLFGGLYQLLAVAKA